MQEEIKAVIKKSTEEILSKMGFSGEIEIKEVSPEAGISAEESIDAGQNNIIVNIKIGEESSFLIGQYGINLQSLQHILRLIVRKKTDDKVKFILDVNNYRQEKNQSIIEHARQAAEQAVTEVRSIALRPMSSYERRIVHMELSKDSRIDTESVGEGENRKVIVKPANVL